MANYLDIAESQKNLEATVLRMFSEFEAKLSAPPAAKVTLNHLSEEFAMFKEQTFTMIKLLREQIKVLTKTQDIQEMRHRRKFLLFNGVPEKAEEIISNRIATIITECLKIPSISSASFKACHRLGKMSSDRVRPVLVRFTDISVKSLVWKKKTAFKGTPYAVSEFLTSQRQSVFMLARKEFGMKSCWSLDGNIFVKLPNGERERVESVEDIVRLKESHTRLLPQSSTPKPADVPVEAEEEDVPGPSSRPGRSRRAANSGS